MRTRSWFPRLVAGLGLLASAAVLGGCEIGLLVAALNDDTFPEDDPDYWNNIVWCNATTGTDWGFEAKQAENGTAKLFGMSAERPTSRLAAGDSFDFFIEMPDLDWGISVGIGVEGDLERLDQSEGACALWDESAGSFVEIETGDSGSGSIVVYDDGSEVDRFEFSVAKVETIEIASFDPNFGQLRARLLDGSGNEVYADAGVLWQVVPSTQAATVTGMRSPPIFFDGINKELSVTVFFKDLSAHVTMKENGFGTMEMVPDE